MHDSNMKTIICFLQKHFFGQTSKILFVTCFSMVVALLSQSSVYISGKFVDFLTTTQNDMSTYKTLLNYSVLFVILNLTAVFEGSAQELLERRPCAFDDLDERVDGSGIDEEYDAEIKNEEE